MRHALLLPLVLFLVTTPFPDADQPLRTGAAWADDDDDGDDDDDDDGDDDGDDDDDDDSGGGGASGGDDDDDDDGGGRASGGDDDDGRGAGGFGSRGDDGGGRRDDRRAAPRGGGFSLFDLFRRREAPRQAAPAPAPAPAPPPPTAAPAEIVTFDLSNVDLETLLAQGFELIEAQEVAGFGNVARRLRVPEGVALADARATVRALPSGQDADFNHYYRTDQAEDAPCDGLHCPTLDLIDWPLSPSRENACGSPVPVGMIDTGINPDHETFTGGRLEVHRRSDEAFEASRAIHGTAVAAILLGDPESRSPGLIPYARLVAVDAFHRVRSDERADVFTLVEALGFLAEEGVAVVNLSLSGPPNTVLERMVEELVEERGIVLVAAAGNDGPHADPRYPAAYDGVVAVTAVDRHGQIYRRAGRGAHIDIAAPGVEVWTAASVSGARWKTGTSFAVPYVTAAATLILQEEPELVPAEVAARLTADASDLGEEGRDDVYGAGLLTLGATCRGVTPTPAALVD